MIFIIRLREEQLNNFLLFTDTYSIKSLGNWTKEVETFFSSRVDYFFGLSVMPSGGVTKEEKIRLIQEHYSKEIINIIKPIE